MSTRLALVLSFLVAFPGFASGPLLPYLVDDITPGKQSVALRLDFWSATLGEVVFFNVAEEKTGLWRTDGTSDGTHRIYDGIADWHGSTRLPVKWNDALYYPVIGDLGTWLFRTDGTTPGTSAVTKISAWYGGAPCGNGKLCFATEGSRIAVTDGTAAGTSELLSTASDFETDLPREMTALGGRVYFNAYDDKNGLCMIVPAGFGERQVCGELWTSDGTVAGTHLFKDILPGGAPGAPEHLLASSAGRLYFAAADPARPGVAQAWVSDGTAEGTRIISPRGSDWAASPYFAELAGRVVFTTSDGDAFETDGTPEDTHSIRDRFALPPFIVIPIGAFNEKILLWVDRNRSEHELWTWDGTTLTKLADIPFDFHYLGQLQTTGLGYFVTDDGQVWSTDGTAAGTAQRFTVRATGATMYPVARTPTRLYYGEGYNRYVTDGTQAGTHQIDLNVPVAHHTYVTQGKVVNGKYFFVPAGKLGASDGTAAGTVILSDEGSILPFAHEGYTYFRDQGELWKTDGTKEGTFLASDWLGASYPRPPAFIGNQAIFSGGDPERLLRRDPDGTLHELGVQENNFTPFVSTAGGVAFWAGQPLRLMFTDGTVTGTRTVSSSIQQAGDLVSLGAKAVFSGSVDGTTLQLWVTDFTAEGTRPLKSFPDVVPLLAWRNLSIFRDDMSESGGVWRSDGTAEGTFQLTTGVFQTVLADGDELVFIRFTDPGYEVWTSDGTFAGTKRRDVYTEGMKAGEPFVMPGGGVGVMYTPRPREIHIRNHRTKAVHVIEAGAMRWTNSGIGYGNLVFLPGYRGSSGHELWAVSLDGTASALPSSVRIEYRGTATTPSGLGAVFRVVLDAGDANRASVVATTVDGTLTAERDYIPFTRAIVFENDQDVTLVVPLRHRDAKGTLSVVLSAPLNATITRGLATAPIGGPARHRAVRK